MTGRKARSLHICCGFSLDFIISIWGNLYEIFYCTFHCFCFLFGVLWWLVDVVRISGMVDEYNDQLLMELVKDSRVVMNDTYEE